MKNNLHNANVIGIEVPQLDIDNVLYPNQPIPNRGKVERRVVANLIAHLEKKGFALASVYDGEEDTKVTTMKAAMELVFNLDDSHIYFKNAKGKEHNVLIVLGNDGWDAVCDWSYTEGDKDGFDKAMDAFCDTVEQYA